MFLFHSLDDLTGAPGGSSELKSCFLELFVLLWSAAMLAAGILLFGWWIAKFPSLAYVGLPLALAVMILSTLVLIWLISGRHAPPPPARR